MPQKSPVWGGGSDIDEAARLANAIIVVKDDRTDPFFDESARSMVRALILRPDRCQF